MAMRWSCFQSGIERKCIIIRNSPLLVNNNLSEKHDTSNSFKYIDEFDPDKKMVIRLYQVIPLVRLCKAKNQKSSFSSQSATPHSVVENIQVSKGTTVKIGF